jgi:SM-20-related protein
MPHPLHPGICAAIEQRGWALDAPFLPEQAFTALRAEARRRDAAGEFHAAGVGRGAARVERSDIRGDRILWLDEHAPRPAEAPLWQALAALQARSTGHSSWDSTRSRATMHSIRPARLPPASRQFRDDDARVISCALYLNEAWSVPDGGALRIHLPDGPHDIVPTGGAFVCFIAERFEHEVLPSPRERLAVSGWFRRRP